MGLPKGRTNNPRGRPEGAKGKRTIEWEKLGDFITDEGAERAARIMRECSDEDFMKYYRDVLEYFKPKQQRQEISAEVETVIKIVEQRAEQIYGENSTSTGLLDEETEDGPDDTEG